MMSLSHYAMATKIFAAWGRGEGRYSLNGGASALLCEKMLAGGEILMVLGGRLGVLL